MTSGRKWLLTFSVMVVAVMQVLDTSVTNVALPHMQGSLSASVEEVAWVITSYLAANAVIIPATGWLTGRRDAERTGRSDTDAMPFEASASATAGTGLSIEAKLHAVFELSPTVLALSRPRARGACWR